MYKLYTAFIARFTRKRKKNYGDVKLHAWLHVSSIALFSPGCFSFFFCFSVTCARLSWSNSTVQSTLNSRIRRPYKNNLYCVGGDVKPCSCSINQVSYRKGNTDRWTCEHWKGSWRWCCIRHFYTVDWFLADRTNGRAIGTVRRRRRRLSVTLCIVAKRCVLEQKLLLTAYRKSYVKNRLVPKWMTLTFV